MPRFIEHVNILQRSKFDKFRPGFVVEYSILNVLKGFYAVVKTTDAHIRFAFLTGDSDQNPNVL